MVVLQGDLEVGSFSGVLGRFMGLFVTELIELLEDDEDGLHTGKRASWGMIHYLMRM